MDLAVLIVLKCYSSRLWGCWGSHSDVITKRKKNFKIFSFQGHRTL